MSRGRMIDADREPALELSARKNVWYMTTYRHHIYMAFLRAAISLRTNSSLLTMGSELFRELCSL